MKLFLIKKNKKKCPCSVNCTAVLHCKERTCNTIPQNCHVVKQKSIGGIFLYSNNNNNYIRMMIMMVVWKHYIRSGLYINNFLTSVRSVVSFHLLAYRYETGSTTFAHSFFLSLSLFFFFNLNLSVVFLNPVIWKCVCSCQSLKQKRV